MTFDIRRAIETTLATGGDRPALAWRSRWSDWNSLSQWRAALDSLLAGSGQAGACVGLVARNSPGCIAALVAQVANGRTTVMIHGAQSPAGIAQDVAGAGLGVLVADEVDWTDEVRAAVREAGIVGIATGGFTGHPHLVLPGDPDRADIVARAPDVGIELLSSGTTGKPKRIPLHWATLSAAAQDAKAAYVGTGARAAPQILLHPLGNIAGVAYLLPAYAFAQPMVLLERFTVADWTAAVREHRPVRASLPAAAMGMLLDSDTPVDALASLEVIAVGGGKLDIDVQDRFEARFGVPVLTAFGATEFAGVIANWTPDLYRQYGRAKRGSAGRASANVRLRIVDPASHAPLPPGETGLLEARVGRLGEQWICTTDLASIDADGFLFVHGRADGAINRGGFKVLPESVVAALTAHPAVADAAVVARADRRLGEVPVAAVELKPGERVTAEALRDWAKDRLLAYQAPAEIRIIDALPRTGSLKIALGEVSALFR